MTLRAASSGLIVPGTIDQSLKRCSANMTANNTTVLANVTGLTGFAVVNLGVYMFEFDLQSTVAAGAGGIQYAFNYTGGATLSAMAGQGLGFTAAAVAVQNTTATATQTAIFSQAAVVIFTRLTGTFVASATGTVDLQMAQNTANVSNSVCSVGSWGRIARIS